MAESQSKKVEDTVGSLFEKEHALFTRNGSTAIFLALTALELNGRKIVIPANICPVVANTIVLSGNQPHFVDIGDDYCLDPAELEKISDPAVAAVIYPYMYGNTGEIERVLEIAGKKKWFVIEDVAQALGARIGKRRAGSFAAISMTSFGVGKIIDAGGGGVLCLGLKELYKKAAAIQSGMPEEDNIDLSEEISVKLTRLEEENELRCGNAAYFQSVLDHEKVVPLKHKEGAVYWRQNLLVKRGRDGLLIYLKSKGVKATKYFQPLENLSRSEEMGEQIINLWPGKETSRKDIDQISELVSQFYGGK